MADNTLDTPGKTRDEEAETPTSPRCINWDDPNLIHTYNDEQGNLIMPVSWRDEDDECDDGLYS